ncbi:MAG: alpha/beta hydrolase, partial [Candidatus Firestonebacteria bacterium]|nr:alpha/beta hydrolase [Candidatus Firestonebacteria bacterium]
MKYNYFFLIILILLPEIAFSQEGKKINIDGQNIFFRVAGNGNKTPILIIHGLGMSSKFWENNMPSLSQDRKVFAIDLPGFGFSDTPRDAALIKNYITLLKKFLSQQKISKVILLGHSTGGSICILYTIRNPNEVEKLILTDSDGGPIIKEDYPFNLLKPIVIGEMIFLTRDKKMI